MVGWAATRGQALRISALFFCHSGLIVWGTLQMAQWSVVWCGVVGVGVGVG